jgi:signal transduction histidine kinase
MTSLKRALLVLGVVGFVAGAVPLALALADEGGHQRELIAITGPLIGWSFIGTGIFAWLRQPENRFGALMTAIGFSACLAGLRVATEPWVFIFGLLFITSQWALLYHMLIAFPSGRLQSRVEILLVGLMYVNSLVVHPIWVLFADTGSVGLTSNPLLIDGHDQLAADLGRARYWVAVVLLSALGVILARRWASASASQRRALAPVLVSGGLVMLLLLAWYIALLAYVDQDAIDRLEDARYIVLATVPFAFVAGLLRSRVVGATAVSEVVARLGDPALRLGGIGEALAGTSLELARWSPDRGEYVDHEGEGIELPAEGSDRSFTPLEPGAEPAAVLIYDRARDDERDLVRAVVAATTLTLENERLATDLSAKLQELTASRARIVESGDTARRRLERDLHDGAQQRLVSLALRLRVLRSRLGDDPVEARELDTASDELDLALEELRELARGLHPPALSEQGLEAALEGLAKRAPLPVDVETSSGERLPDRVESAAYFVVAEALTNVAKYARATRAGVTVSRSADRVLVEVTDDGVGGADPAAGSGLRGLLDRVAALDGTLEVDSERGRGTTVKAAIPCDDNVL